MKKIIIRISLVVVCLVVVALAVVFFSLNSIVKKGVETVGPQLTKVEVKLGSAEISPFSGSGRLSKLFVGNPEGYKTPSAFQMGSIKVAVKIGSVMSDVIVVNEVNIQAPVITFEGGLTGENNLSKILDNLNASSATQEKQKTEAPATAKKEKKFIVKKLVFEGGIINLSLKGVGSAPPVPLPPLNLTDIGTAQNGVTAAELTQAIMKPLVAEVLTAVVQNAGTIGKELQNMSKGGTDQLKGAAKGITDLFKKK